MELIDSKTYNVVDGEPHLGKQIEETYRVSREEYIEGLIDAFLNGCENESDEFDIEDTELDIVQPYSLGYNLTQMQINEIIKRMNEELLDDDYGSGKDYKLLYELLDERIPNGWYDDIEFIGRF